MSNCKEQLLAAIAPDVAAIEKTMRTDLRSCTADCDPLLKEILDYGIFNGGKRLRPLLVLLAARFCGRNFKSEEDLLLLAISFEYLHGATLYHDDVIDRADSRRGKPSVVAQFGEIAAILGGDFLHSRSMFLIGTIGGHRALEIFCRATSGMVDGEFLQLRNVNNYNLNEADYFTAVRGKTSQLIGAACEIGALAGGGGDDLVQAMGGYGLSLGTSFQIVDDLLDYLGDPEITGKDAGNDFREGKMTLPVILASRRAAAADRDRLLSLLGSDAEDGFGEALEIIERYDGFAGAGQKAATIMEEAMTGLKRFAGQSSPGTVELLHMLGEYVINRKK